MTKLGLTIEPVKELLSLLSEIAVGKEKTPEGTIEPVTTDPDHDLILACAIKAKVDVLISGDRKHLLPVGEHRGVRIHTPQAFLAELRN